MGIVSDTMGGRVAGRGEGETDTMAGPPLRWPMLPIHPDRNRYRYRSWGPGYPLDRMGYRGVICHVTCTISWGRAALDHPSPEVWRWIMTS